MNRLTAFATATCLGLLTLAYAPNAKADEWNKRTILTVNEPLQIPGQVLQPGKYVMRLLDSPSNRHIVQVYNNDESHLITTILAIPNYRLRPTGKTQFTFWETPAGQPPALRAWFYPGDLFGQEFAYKPAEATQIAQQTNQSVVTTEANNATELQNAPVHTTTPQGNQENLGEQYNAPAAQTPTPAAQTPTPAPAPVAQPQIAHRTRLPRTGSDMPLVGLVGLLALGAGLSAALVRKRLA